MCGLHPCIGMATILGALSGDPAPAMTVIDPVCGMTITASVAVGTVDYGGRKYYFCSESCLTQFRDNPARFVDRQPSSTAGEVTATRHAM